MMTRRVAVYDRYWSTAGGGETYAGGVAAMLSTPDSVTLISHEPIDTAWLAERLALDLSRVDVRVVDECCSFEDLSAEYDVFINLSFGSHAPNRAKRGLYVVYFPDDPDDGLARWQRMVRGSLSSVAGRARGPISVVRGFHDPAISRTWRIRWTDGDGVLRVAPSSSARTLHVALGRFIPGGAEREVVAEIDGREVGRARIVRPAQRWRALAPVTMPIDLPASSRPIEVHLRSTTSTPDEVLGNGDRRALGVPMLDARIGRAPSVLPWISLVTVRDDVGEWLDTYDSIVSISAFTSDWISRLWRRPSLVVEPPVTMRTPAAKEPIVLSVGRFFGEERGHSKKQLEMVRAFGRLGAVAKGWTLHLVGGCAEIDAPYLAEVRRAAEGLDVVLHVDASGAELDALYSRASIYWHATGLGDDLTARPERAEHFGITTVEAMSAGAVPVVHDAGGQPEIVRDGVDGFVFRDVDELLDRTRRLLADDELRSSLSASAIERAQRYSTERFAARFRALVD